MKTRKYIILALSILSFGSCKQEQEEAENLVFTATIGDNDKTLRTQLAENGESYKVAWSADNAFTLFDGSNYFKMQNSDADFAHFSLASDGTPNTTDPTYYAYYPCSTENTYSDGHFNVTLPAEQANVDGNIAEASFPMMAVSQNTNLRFYNLACVVIVHVTAKSAQYVNSIELSTTDEEACLSGPATASLGLGEKVPVLSMVGTETANKSVKLNCGEGTDGVFLGTNTTKSFFLSIPYGTYTNLNVAVTSTASDENNSKTVTTSVDKTNVTFERSKFHNTTYSLDFITLPGTSGSESD